MRDKQVEKKKKQDWVPFVEYGKHVYINCK
jgi:hypothetical protein